MRHQWPIYGATLGFVSVFFALNFQTAITNIGVMDSTLRTFTAHACQGNTLTIRCPAASTISVHFARYGRRVPSYQMCPAFSHQRKPNGGAMSEDITCVATSSLQVMLDLCQEKQKCLVAASVTTFGQDPCPGTLKYLEVAYKCRPSDFETNTVCEGGHLNLRCQDNKRIVIYSAFFGRTQSGNSKCPYKVANVACQSWSAMDVTMKRCHGRHHCKVRASSRLFGSPCSPQIPTYLTIIHTCAHRKILKELRRVRGGELISTYNNIRHRQHRDRKSGNRHRLQPTDNNFFPSHGSTFLRPLTPLTTTGETLVQFNGHRVVYANNDRASAIPDTSHSRELDLRPMSRGYDHKTVTPCMNTTGANNYLVVRGKNMIGYVTDWMTVVKFLQKNSEKAILYMCVGALVGTVLMMLLIIVKLLIDNKRKSRAKLDISEPVHPGHNHSQHHTHQIETASLERSESTADMIEVVRFSPRGTLRSERAGPVSLHNDSTSRSLNNYYYG